MKKRVMIIVKEYTIVKEKLIMKKKKIQRQIRYRALLRGTRSAICKKTTWTCAVSALCSIVVKRCAGNSNPEETW